MSASDGRFGYRVHCFVRLSETTDYSIGKHFAEAVEFVGAVVVKHIFNTLLFTVLVPATVAGWIPRALRDGAVASPNLAVRLLAFVLIVIGIAIYLHTAFWGFAWRGLGTPAPIAPPEKLVVEGLHRYVRNPMYIGVLLIVIGQAVWFHSRTLAEYAAFLWLAAHVFVLLYEEPALQRKFGDEYRAYRQRVPRWIPHL